MLSVVRFSVESHKDMISLPRNSELSLVIIVVIWNHLKIFLAEINALRVKEIYGEYKQNIQI